MTGFHRRARHGAVVSVVNVNVVIKTSDGALIYQQMLGRSVRDADEPTN